MKIIELYLKNFGKFKDTRIHFEDGVNLIYGENEMGKSTLFVFIKGMLFGIDKQRGKASRNDTYSIYEPWDFPGYYAGVMRFQIDDKVFRLERNFEKSQKTAILVCETDGEELSVARGDLDILLDGINEVNYRNTVGIGQLKCETDSGLSEEIGNYMTNFEKTGDMEVDVSKATAGLQQTYKRLEKRFKELEADQRAKRQSIQIQMNYIQDEINDKGLKKAKCQDEIIVYKQKLSTIESAKGVSAIQSTPSEPAGITQYSKQLAGMFAFVLTVIACIVLSELWLKLTAGALGFVILIIVIIRLRNMYKREKNRVSSYNGDNRADNHLQEPSHSTLIEVEGAKDEYTLRKEEYQLYLSKKIWYMDTLEEELIEKRTLLENMVNILEEGIQVSQEQIQIRTKLEALTLSIQTIDKLSGIIGQEKGNWINKETSEILSEITDGKYTLIRIDDKGKVFINTPDKLLGLEKVSRGTMEQVYFALRMASAKVLYQAELMPVILDDVFAMYDEKRLSRALQWLSESGLQVLIFTCHKREKEILKQESIPFYEVL